MFVNYIGTAPEYIIILAVLWVSAIVFKRTVLFAVAFIASICLLWFFQGALSLPTTIDPRILYCPCDGVVSDIIHHGDMVQICVFLNIHNTHVQYSPFDCTVTRIRHKEGVSTMNEQNTFFIIKYLEMLHLFKLQDNWHDAS